jgi:acyl carrier protein
MDVRTTILEQMQKVAANQEIELGPLTDETLLLETGLTSLGVAILVADLEELLGVDPFSTGDDTTMPVTIGEFVRLYEENLIIEKQHVATD